MLNKVLLIYTGGTIGMNRNPQTGALEPFDFEHLLQNVPELRQFDLQIDTYQFQPPIDSSDMSPRLWTDLSHVIADRYTDYDGFVVLHGTDTMAYTASVLSYMMENLTKPIIFTGSQLPIGLLRTDGKENLITSIEIAAACDDEGHALVTRGTHWFPRWASTSTAICCEAIALPSRVQTSSTPSSRSTILTWPMLVSTSAITASEY